MGAKTMTDEPEKVPLEDTSPANKLSAQEFKHRIGEYQQTASDLYHLHSKGPDLYYTHSGRPGFAAPLALLIGFPAIATLAALYSYIVVYCPFVGYVNVIPICGFVVAVGYVIRVLGRLGKCRNSGFMGFIGFACGVFALYASWIFFITALTGKRGPVLFPLDLVLHPIGFAKLIYEVNQEGWWGPGGLVRWILVGLEAVIMIAWPIRAGLGSLDSEVFCEDCNRWCKLTDKISLRPTTEMFAVGVGNVQPEHFIDLEDATETDFPRLEAEVLQCPRCQKLQAIRFEYVSLELEKAKLKEHRIELPKVLIQQG